MSKERIEQLSADIDDFIRKIEPHCIKYEKYKNDIIKFSQVLHDNLKNYKDDVFSLITYCFYNKKKNKFICENLNNIINLKKFFDDYIIMRSALSKELDKCNLFKNFKVTDEKKSSYTEKVIDSIYKYISCKKSDFPYPAAESTPEDILKDNKWIRFGKSTIKEYYKKNKEKWKKFMNTVQSARYIRGVNVNFEYFIIPDYNKLFDIFKNKNKEILEEINSKVCKDENNRKEFIKTVQKFLDEGKIKFNPLKL